MVHPKVPVTQDHMVIRQLLSTGARVPPIAVFKVSPTSTDTCANQNYENSSNNTTITDAFELISSEDKYVTNFSDIDVSDNSELFPEIGLPLPDLNDIDDVVFNDTNSPSTNNVQSVNSCSFSNTPDDIYAIINNTGFPGPNERRSPMQICSSSDSESSSSPPPSQSCLPSPKQDVASPPGEVSAIKSLLSRPSILTGINLPKSTATTSRSGRSKKASRLPTQSTDIMDVQDESPVQNIPATVDAVAAIPLTVLALADDENAPASQLMLKQLDQQESPCTVSEPSSDEELEVQVTKPARRRWITKVADIEENNAPKRKRERKTSSLSSERDLDDDDDDEDYEDFSEDEDNHDRVHKRRHNNRIAAQRCRQRKRQYYLSLTKEIQQWECSNTTLKYEIHTLQKQLQDMQQVLQDHESVCTLDPADIVSASADKKAKRKSKRKNRSHKHKR